MICSNSLRQLRPFSRPWPPWIGGNVAKRLLQKVPIPHCGAPAEFLQTPFQDFTNVALRGGSQNNA
jgi:hypothetical protein